MDETGAWSISLFVFSLVIAGVATGAAIVNAIAAKPHVLKTFAETAVLIAVAAFFFLVALDASEPVNSHVGQSNASETELKRAPQGKKNPK